MPPLRGGCGRSTTAGISALDAFPFLAVSVAVDREPFLSIAKLRALRLCWARLQELCGAPRQPPAIHAETSRRMLTRADPTTNLLRTTLAAFAAGGGRRRYRHASCRTPPRSDSRTATRAPSPATSSTS